MTCCLALVNKPVGLLTKHVMYTVLNPAAFAAYILVSVLML